VPCHRQLTAVFQLRRPDSTPTVFHVGFVVDGVAVDQVFHPALRFSPTSYIPTVSAHIPVTGVRHNNPIRDRSTKGRSRAPLLPQDRSQRVPCQFPLHHRRSRSTTKAESTTVVPVSHSRNVCVPWGIFMLRWTRV
jgi:hypothetical protein